MTGLWMLGLGVLQNKKKPQVERKRNKVSPETSVFTILISSFSQTHTLVSVVLFLLPFHDDVEACLSVNTY